MTQGEWLRVCATISRLWPHKPMPPEAAEAWFPLLADLDGSAVMAAVNTYALSPDATWPPSLGELRADAEPPDRPWEDALGELRSLISRHGSYATLGGKSRPRAEDPALDAVIEAYGWQQVCALDDTNPTTRAQFRDAYRGQQKAQRDAGRRVLAVQALPGGRQREITGGAA